MYDKDNKLPSYAQSENLPSYTQLIKDVIKNAISNAQNRGDGFFTILFPTKVLAENCSAHLRKNFPHIGAPTIREAKTPFQEDFPAGAHVFNLHEKDYQSIRSAYLNPKAVTEEFLKQTILQAANKAEPQGDFYTYVFSSREMAFQCAQHIVDTRELLKDIPNIREARTPYQKNVMPGQCVFNIHKSKHPQIKAKYEQLNNPDIQNESVARVGLSPSSEGKE